MKLLNPKKWASLNNDVVQEKDLLSARLTESQATNESLKQSSKEASNRTADLEYQLNLAREAYEGVRDSFARAQEEHSTNSNSWDEQKKSMESEVQVGILREEDLRKKLEMEKQRYEETVQRYEDQLEIHR